MCSIENFVCACVRTSVHLYGSHTAYRLHPLVYRTSLERKKGKLSVSLRCSVRERSLSDAESTGRQQAIRGEG